MEYDTLQYNELYTDFIALIYEKVYHEFSQHVTLITDV